MKRLRTLFAWGLVVFSLALLPLAVAGDVTPKSFQLQLPIACQLGKNCWVVNYFDQDPGPEAFDYHHGSRTYNKHDGVDIGLRDIRQMENGVPVLASAPGVVRFIRDGEIDMLLSEKPFPTNKECGNGVLLEHGEGYTTQYCHMKQGSIRVKPGDRVKTGQVLGQVGLSGMTAFPHVHITLRHNGQALDPFTGTPAENHYLSDSSPQEETASYWAPQLREQLQYHTGILYNHGISDHPQEAAKIRAGQTSPAQLNLDTPLLTAWVDIWGIRAGDKLSIQITDPTGNLVFNQSVPLNRNMAISYYEAKMHRPKTGWLKGDYTVKYIYDHQNASSESIVEQARF